MSQTIRLPEILEIARRDGKVTVEQLADHLGVTLQTIRRDLSELAEAGKLERVHGGAVLPSGTINIAYEERRQLNAEGKTAMARACAAMIPEDCAIFLNLGTSTEAVATELLHHRNLLVVTNNMNVANILTRNPDCEVIVTGGSLRQSDGGLIGDITTAAIRKFKFDIGIIGCSAIDQDGDILDFDLREVGVSQTILHQSRRAMLIADQTKFKRTAPARIGSLSDIDVLFTDAPLTRGLQDRCADWATQIDVSPADLPRREGSAG
ncbi:DeoR/GlpR family DNA-binding transcription regulator [Pseudooceanicola algae]|uniref:Glycerol-3-phosphate regulon repressor n=1 Tax=Pseudooceanicola algae TaxID=1537215 RepID=A0A418SBQ3_9RHOB|nr:DeoR/GlpR family DNA-binding transcription regulator [Pseudooceanicola algae]QPM92439.1 Glycerol-3-phosphate regulon repressor [Pseudooceanicola algae]